MNDSVRENLLGLLLGALEDDERRALEEQLEVDAELRAEFAELRELVRPLDEQTVNYEPASGLADRTFAFVQREAALIEAGAKRDMGGDADQLDVVRAVTGPTRGAVKRKAQLSPVKEQGGRRSWKFSDVVAVVSVLVISLSLLLPAMLASWETSNRLACQANLYQIGWALNDYAQQRPDHRLPEIATSGNRAFAGNTAATLVAANYITDPQTFLCASSNLKLGSWRMPALTEIERASGAELIRLQRLAGGSFGYNLGHREEGRVVAPSIRNQAASYVWAADAPAWTVVGRMSENHGGRGQNLLFADQHVSFVTSCVVAPTCDDAFRSERGFVEAGVDSRDSVIGESLAHPVANSQAHPAFFKHD